MPLRWIQKVKTVSTFPPKGTFAANRTGLEIATIMARPEVSPKGWNSAIAMVVYFKNRGGKRLTEDHKRNLDEAIEILQKWRDHEGHSS